MLDAAARAGVDRFVQCSSLTTLVGKSTPIGPSVADESVAILPDDMLGPYPRSKWFADSAAMAAANATSMEVMIAIPTEPIGPGDDSLTPPTQMMLDFINGKTPAYIDCILNFVATGSLAKGLIAVHDRGSSGERYLLGGENRSLRWLLDVLSAKTGRPMPTLKLPYQVALFAGLVESSLVSPLTGRPPKAPLTGVRLAGRQVSFSSEKAKHELGWQAEGFDDALDALLLWFDEKGLSPHRKIAP